MRIMEIMKRRAVSSCIILVLLATGAAIMAVSSHYNHIHSQVIEHVGKPYPCCSLENCPLRQLGYLD